MTSSLHRRLIVLERAPAAEPLVLQVFGDAAEADANTEVPDSTARVVRIITGVPRWPDAGAS